jgi:hypothetical protein
MGVNSCVVREVLVAKIKETCFLAILFHFGLWMGSCAVLWGNCVVSWGSGHHKSYDGMARHFLLALGMHLYVEWQLMEIKIHKHLFSSFFAIFGDG